MTADKNTINRDKFIKVFEEEMTSEELKQSYQTPSENEQESPAQAFLTKIKSNKGMLYGLIGEYGTGKSSFLNAVRDLDEKTPKIDSEKPNIRITFEAWKYPDRKELRDAFIIEVLAKIVNHIQNNKTKKEKKDIFTIMDQIKKKLTRGIYTDDDQKLLNSNKRKGGIGRIMKDGGEVIQETSSIYNNEDRQKYALLGSGLVMKFLGGMIESSIREEKEGISRLFDYEYFFEQYRTNIIKSYSKEFGKVYIIIEDIDRCDRDGMIFIETLSYFISQISGKDRMSDKLICIVSVGNQFLQDNRHLINKTITNYSFFEMKVDSIVEYFEKSFTEAGLNQSTITILINFIKYYLETDGTKRTIREIKYLFRKITPLIQKKGEWIGASNEVILGMMLFNFSLFVRSNKEIKTTKEIFDSKRSLQYGELIPIKVLDKMHYKMGSEGYQMVYYPFFRPHMQQIQILKDYDNLGIYKSLFGAESISINNIICIDNDEIRVHGFNKDTIQLEQQGNPRDYTLYLFSPYRLLNE